MLARVATRHPPAFDLNLGLTHTPPGPRPDPRRCRRPLRSAVRASVRVGVHQQHLTAAPPPPSLQLSSRTPCHHAPARPATARYTRTRAPASCACSHPSFTGGRVRRSFRRCVAPRRQHVLPSESPRLQEHVVLWPGTARRKSRHATYHLLLRSLIATSTRVRMGMVVRRWVSMTACPRRVVSVRVVSCGSGVLVGVWVAILHQSRKGIINPAAFL